MARHEQPPARRRWVRFKFWLAVLWTVWWVGWTVLSLAMAVSQWTGLDPEPDYDAALGAVMIAAFTGGLTATGVIMARGCRESEPPSLTVRRPQPPDSASPRVDAGQRCPLPRQGSVARPPMRQLAKAESALAALLRQLRDSVPADMVDDVRQTAADTAAGLRAASARIEAVELAAGQLPPAERTALEDGIGDLLTRVEQRLDAYRGLIVAAGRVLLATDPTPTGDELAEETERLAALAEALRDLP